MLAAAAICDRCACPDIQKFVNGLPYRPLVRDALAKQLNENDDSLSSGVFGNLAIAHRILPDSEFHFLVEEVRASNLLAAPRPDLLPGLMTGMTGRYVGVACLEGADWSQIPLLPHEFCKSFALEQMVAIS